MISSAFLGTTGTKSSVADGVTGTMFIASGVAVTCGVQPMKASNTRNSIAVSAKKRKGDFDMER